MPGAFDDVAPPRRVLKDIQCFELIFKAAEVGEGRTDGLGRVVNEVTVDANTSRSRRLK